MYIGASSDSLNKPCEMICFAGAGLLAFVVGKWSYRNVCREKILRLENSALADAMRRGKAGLGEVMRDQ